MGILTTQDSARGFSTCVALFGLALLITSATYLRDLDYWAANHSCLTTLRETEYRFKTDILCSDLNTWRTAAIIGIVIGAVDVLVVPFLLCCRVCIVCGCTALICCCIDCDDSSENQTTTTITTPATNDRNESATPTDNGNEATEQTINKANESLTKFNLKNLPKPLAKMLNITGWIVWVFLPFIGTLWITIWLYKRDAIRTQDDELYSSALSLFVCGLFNLMVFTQKFIDSVCKLVCEKFCGNDESEERNSVGSV